MLSPTVMIWIAQALVRFSEGLQMRPTGGLVVALALLAVPAILLLHGIDLQADEANRAIKTLPRQDPGQRRAT